MCYANGQFLHQDVHRPLVLHRSALLWDFCLCWLRQLAIFLPYLFQQQHKILPSNGERLFDCQAAEVEVDSSQIISIVCRQDRQLIVGVAPCSIDEAVLSQATKDYSLPHHSTSLGTACAPVLQYEVLQSLANTYKDGTSYKPECNRKIYLEDRPSLPCDSVLQQSSSPSSADSGGHLSHTCTGRARTGMNE